MVRYAAQGVAHRVQTPGVHVLLPRLFETLEPCGGFCHRTAIFLQDNLLSRCLTDDLGEPPEMGRAPVGPAGGADIVAEQERCEAQLGVFAIAAGIFACPSEIAHGCIFDGGNIDGGQIA
jgi:hypothetical protein